MVGNNLAWWQPSVAGGTSHRVDWVRDAFAHLKVIGHVPGAAPLIERAGIAVDEGVIALGGAKDVTAFVAAAKGPRIWQRERAVEQRVAGTPTRKDRGGRPSVHAESP